jgi:hypothetical protein
MMSGGDRKYSDDEKPSSSTGGSKGGKKGPKKDNAYAIESKGSGKGKKAKSGDDVGHHGKMTKTSGDLKYDDDDEVKGSYDTSVDTAGKGAKSKTGGSRKDDKSYGPHGDDDHGNDDDSEESHISNDEVGGDGKGKHSQTKKHRESDDHEKEHYQQAHLSIRSTSHVVRGFVNVERVWMFLSVVHAIGLFT